MSVSTWVSWCIVEINTTDLYFFGTYDTSVLFSWNANADDNSCRLRYNIGGGIARLFFRIVPTYVKPCWRSSSTSATLVKKLSPTTLRPLLYHGDNIVVTIRSPWLTSRSWAGSLPRYTSAFSGYDVALIAAPPRLHTVFGGLTRYVLSDRTASPKRDKLFVDCQIPARYIKFPQLCNEHGPHVTKGRKFVCCSALFTSNLVIKSTKTE